MSSDAWILVTSESELREGMAVQLRPCIWCGRAENLILLRKARTTIFMRAPGGEIEVAPSGSISYSYLGDCRRTSDHGNFSPAIADRRLFRLRPDQLSEATTAEKRKVVAR